MPPDSRKDQFAELVREATGGSATILQSTNGQANVPAAVQSGSYVEYGGIDNPQVNFDMNFNAKSGMAGAYGYTRAVSQGTDIRLYVILGPLSVNESGPSLPRWPLTTNKPM